MRASVRRFTPTLIGRHDAGRQYRSDCGLGECSGLPVIASGGISHIDDVRGLMPHARKGICGVTGRAIYEGPRSGCRTAEVDAFPELADGTAKRIIPCLDVDQGRVVKGVNFVGMRDAGDPVEITSL